MPSITTDQIQSFLADCPSNGVLIVNAGAKPKDSNSMSFGNFPIVLENLPEGNAQKTEAVLNKVNAFFSTWDIESIAVYGLKINTVRELRA